MYTHAGSPEDFPAMWQKPSYDDILACLDSLRLQADADADANPIWHCSVPLAHTEAHHQSAAAALHARRDASAVARYLDSIVMSDLAWLPDDDAREALWTAASQRIAERCGRSAMGEITRRWPLSRGGSAMTSAAASDSGCDYGWSAAGDRSESETVDLVLREPALVGDALGFKTWGTAYVLARMLPALAERPDLAALRGVAVETGTKTENKTKTKTRILELGAGTGLLGLAAAVLWRADVVLTDLPAIVPNLAANVARNKPLLEADSGGSAQAAVLTWGGRGPDAVDPVLFGDEGAERRHQFGIVLAADPLYDDGHPALLASAIDEQLGVVTAAGMGTAQDPLPHPRAVVMVPLRDHHTEALAQAFVEAMAGRGLAPVDEGHVVGQDSDWDGGHSGDDGTGDADRFPCQWWIFGRT